MITRSTMDRKQYLDHASKIQEMLPMTRIMPKAESDRLRKELSAPFSDCRCEKCQSEAGMLVCGTYANPRFDFNGTMTLQDVMPYTIRLRCMACNHRPSVFPYDIRPYSSIATIPALMGVFEIFRNGELPIRTDDPTETMCFHPEGDTVVLSSDVPDCDPAPWSDHDTDLHTDLSSLGNGFYFDGGSFFSSATTFPRLIFNRELTDWPFPLSVSSLYRIKKLFADDLQRIRETLIRLGLLSCEENLSMMHLLQKILLNWREFLQMYISMHNRAFLSRTL